MAEENNDNEKVQVNWWLPKSLRDDLKIVAEYEYQAGGKVNSMAIIALSAFIESKRKNKWIRKKLEAKESGRPRKEQNAN